MDERLEVVIAVILLLIALVFVNLVPTGFVASEGVQSGIVAEVDFAEFAQCLTRNGIVLYTGTNPDSEEQLNMFREGISYIDNVNCANFRQICDRKGIKSFPAWEIYGERYVGVIPLGSLSDISGCKL